MTPRPLDRWDMGLDELVLRMARLGVGRPSTYASSLDGLIRSGVIVVTPGAPVRLTEAGVAAALLCEGALPDLLGPGFTRALGEELARIETGDASVPEVLGRLGSVIARGGMEHVATAPTWRDLDDLARRLDASASEGVPTALIGGRLTSDPGPAP